MSGTRALLAGLALSATSLILTLTGLELAMRADWLEPTSFRSTRIDTWANSEPQRPSFRRSGFALDERESDFRIVVVGDSFAWGDGVHAEDAFPARLETRLTALSRGERYEVVNWSRPGWNTVRQAKTLEWALPKLDPDLLVLSFVLNDPEPFNQNERDAMLATARRREPASGVSEWLYRSSRLYEFAWTRLENRRQHRAVSDYYRGLYEGEHWDACVRSLKALRRMARQQRVPFVVYIFPVFDGPMDDSYEYLDLHEVLGAELDDLGIEFVDLLEVYRGIEGRRLAVMPYYNPHPSELAHRLAADAILDHLVREDLLPPIRYRLFRQLQADSPTARRRRAAG